MQDFDPREMELGIQLSTGQLDFNSLSHDDALKVVKVIEGQMELLPNITLDAGSGHSARMKALSYGRLMQQAEKLTRCGYPDVEAKIRALMIKHQDNVMGALKDYKAESEG